MNFNDIPNSGNKSDWQEQPIEPVNEQVVLLNGVRPDALVIHPMSPSPPPLYVREAVMNLLLMASSRLPSGYKLVIWEGWRSSENQFALFDKVTKDLINLFPNSSTEDIHQLAQLYISTSSSVATAPCPHSTGGAVDVSLVDDKGQLLLIDSLYTNNLEVYATGYYENQMNFRDLTEMELDLLNKRRLLHNAMTSVGFTNSPNKWWHFDFGNQSWAAVTGKTAFYEETSPN